MQSGLEVAPLPSLKTDSVFAYDEDMGWTNMLEREKKWASSSTEALQAPELLWLLFFSAFVLCLVLALLMLVLLCLFFSPLLLCRKLVLLIFLTVLLMACLLQPEPEEIQVVLQPEGRGRGPCWASAAGQGWLSGLLYLSLLWTFPLANNWSFCLWSWPLEIHSSYSRWNIIFKKWMYTKSCNTPS